MKRLIKIMIALALAVPVAVGSEVQEATPAAAQDFYVGWAAYYGCDTNDIHYRLTEHAMYLNGVPDHKRFYVDILIGGTMVHQNAYHASTFYDVYPARVAHVEYPSYHIADRVYPGTDTHHCRFVFSRWTHDTSVSMNAPDSGEMCCGFYGWDRGDWSAGVIDGYGWTETSDWIEPQQQCAFAMPTCNGANQIWWDRCDCWHPNGTYQDVNNFYTDTFVDGY